MRRVALAMVLAVLTTDSVRADWGTPASGMPTREEPELEYGPPQGYSSQPMPERPMDGPATTLGSYMNAPPARPPARYGLHPCLRKLLWWKKDEPYASPKGNGYGPGGPVSGGPVYGQGGPGCGYGPPGYGPGGPPYGYGGPGGSGGGPGGPGGGPGGPGGGPGYGPPLNYGPAQQQGTLVFPNHPFVRGPRDFYMWGSERDQR